VEWRNENVLDLKLLDNDYIVASAGERIARLLWFLLRFPRCRRFLGYWNISDFEPQLGLEKKLRAILKYNQQPPAGRCYSTTARLRHDRVRVF
jgi:hypothetical protein